MDCVKAPGSQMDPNLDKVIYMRLCRVKRLLVAFHKPPGVVPSVQKDEFEIKDILPDEFKHKHRLPLDKASRA